jgi:hypothetical protein
VPNLVTFGPNNKGTVAMADDSPEDTPPSPDSGRAKRAPPTIDLEASEVSGETRNAGADVPPEPQPEPERISREPSAPISPWVIAPVSGAVAANHAPGQCRCHR